MKSDILDALDRSSEEFKESFAVFQQYYPTIGLVFFIKSLLLPLKMLTTSTPRLSHFSIILDCVNTEKYKRMKRLITSDSNALVYVSDLSTERSQLFCSNLDNSVKKVSQKVRYRNYWKYLFTIIFQTISEAASFSHYFALLTFKARAIQELIQYDWLLGATRATTLCTANEDNWISAVLARFCRLRKIKTVNVMHGRVYLTKQFYDYSVVYGRASAEATKKLAAPHTLVQQHSLAEIEENQASNHFEHHQKIVLFDQPASDLYPQEMRTAVYGLLEILVKKHGLMVFIKPHPAQNNLEEIAKGPFQIIQGKTNQEILLQTGIAISICSTVAMEVISSGVVMIYFNEGRLLDRFLQIKFLSDSSPKNISEVESLVLNLQNRDFYEHFEHNQLKLLKTEYGVISAPKLDMLDTKHG